MKRLIYTSYIHYKMQLITFKMNKSSLKRLDEMCRAFDFASRTEFMRQAIRKLVEEYEYRIAINKLKKLRGSAKTKTSDEELEKIREEVARELYPEYVK